MCGPYIDDSHSPNCTCNECMPEPNYWNGIDQFWHEEEMQRRREAAWEEETGHLREWGF